MEISKYIKFFWVGKDKKHAWDVYTKMSELVIKWTLTTCLFNSKKMTNKLYI